jgi:geranylgeranyl pyrophosphate synthase
LRAVTTREQAEEVCDRIAATDALVETRARAAELIHRAKAGLRGTGADLKHVLSAVANRVADRYA